MKKAITSISFLSICVAYSAGLAFCAITDVLEQGRLYNFEFIIFWSGLFELLAWLVFIMVPLRKLDHSKKIFNKWIFPFVSAVYAVVVFLILIGWLYLNDESDWQTVFGIATVVGLTFGFVYSQLISNQRVVDFYNGKLLPRLTALLYPILFLWLYLVAFPKLFPATAFKFMPDEIQNRIIAETIPKFKVGDDIEDLKKSLPSYLDHIQNGKGNMSASMENFAFVLQVNCGKIIRLGYGKNPSDFDNTIYGKLEEQPAANKGITKSVADISQHQHL